MPPLVAIPATNIPQQLNHAPTEALRKSVPLTSQPTSIDPVEENDQLDEFAAFEKEWLDAEIAQGVTNRDVCRSLMMLMGRMG